MAPRKVRLIAKLVKGMDYLPARQLLQYANKKAAEPVLKLLESAAANGHNNLNLVKDNLYIKDIVVDEGVKLKRFRAKGFGLAALIQKKTSHITLVMDEKVKGLVRQPDKEEKKIHEPAMVEEKDLETEEKEGKQTRQMPVEVKGRRGGLFDKLQKKIFRRKTV